MSVGFRLMSTVDPSRSYPQDRAGGAVADGPRPLRLYVWYPISETPATTLPFEHFARLAAEDFSVVEEGKPLPLASPPLPVPLARGLPEEQLHSLLQTPTASHVDAQPAAGRFPLLVVGQGLYYESPLSQLVMCEYLASWGYVVATCPLLGTQYRLVNLNITDLETAIRDLEFVLGRASSESFVDADRIGVIGYDLGGMAGITLTMRNPHIAAFLSLDSAILYGHFSGLPNKHPSYDITHMTVPWMHMTQDRFLAAARAQRAGPDAMTARRFGDNYLFGVTTQNHGDFSSYATYGIQQAVRGYWDQVEEDRRSTYEATCLCGRRFFDAYLKNSADARQWLQRSPQEWGLSEVIADVQRRIGGTRPMGPDQWIHRIIRDGADQTIPALREAQRNGSGKPLLDEATGNWLGYHFLYWWGRPAEAILVFQFIADTHPDSANAMDSLAEAFLVNANRTEAIRCYRKSLELNPDNENAKAALTRLTAE